MEPFPGDHRSQLDSLLVHELGDKVDDVDFKSIYYHTITPGSQGHEPECRIELAISRHISNTLDPETWSLSRGYEMSSDDKEVMRVLKAGLLTFFQKCKNEMKVLEDGDVYKRFVKSQNKFIRALNTKP